MQDGKLLDAHKSLVELENSRDDLLFELHKLPHQSPADRQVDLSAEHCVTLITCINVQFPFVGSGPTII